MGVRLYSYVLKPAAVCAAACNPVYQLRRLRVDARDLLRLSRCGFSQSALQSTFQARADEHAIRASTHTQ